MCIFYGKNIFCYLHTFLDQRFNTNLHMYSHVIFTLTKDLLFSMSVVNITDVGHSSLKGEKSEMKNFCMYE